ncbi:Ger(x)C family spore germination protein [Anaerobacillus sp. MEB173]|uniref:Ger(x)C family spore germination protein n=1 Tax=Anaerobacillus sp. MEB173 TaxID=3383345 RepID=UPI003F8E0E9A
MKRLFKLIICIIVPVALTGCWDRLEVNDLAIVTGTSFDRVNETTFRIAAQIPLPGQMGGAGSSGGGGGTSGGASYYLDAGVGKSVREANADLQKRMSRRLSFGHRRVAIFGEGLARDGLSKALDVLTRTRDSRLTTQIFIAEGEAMPVLSANPQLESFSSEIVREIGVYTFYLTVKDFLLNFQQKGNDPILPVISVTKNVSPNPELVEDQIEIEKVAIFQGDKLQFFTDQKQTVAVKYLLEKMEGEFYTIDFEPGKSITLRITEQNTDLSYRLENDKPVFQYKIDVYGNVIENETELNFEDKGVLDIVNKQMEKEIVKAIQPLLTETLSRGIDSFGFGWLLHRRERERWNEEWKQNWKENLPNIDYEIQVNASVEFTGLVTEGIGIGE